MVAPLIARMGRESGAEAPPVGAAQHTKVELHHPLQLQMQG